MTNELQVPEHLRQAMTEAGATTSDVDSAVASSMSVPRISLRGRTFRFIQNGQEIKKQNESINVIILGVEPEAGRMVKTYYEAGYSPGSSAPPDCASHDGISPSPWVNKKQSKFCADCKWNQFGSATSPTGKPTKKCRDAKQLWVLDAVDPKGVEGVQYGMNVTVSSLKDFSDYGRKLKANNLTFAAVITKLTMADSEFPQITFEVAGFATAEQIKPLLALSAERPWKINMASAALPAPEPAVRLPGAADMSAVPPHVQAAMSTAPAEATKSVNDIVKNW